jgi:uncharacterized protein YdaU (DUF1376 family)
MRAAWWWIDRWRKSTAYTDMTPEQKGVYRDLLDELWIRDGVIPKDEKILRKIAGADAACWKRVRKAVLAHFTLTRKGYRNETHDKIQHESELARRRQERYRASRDASHNASRDASRNGRSDGEGDGNVMRPPSPALSLPPPKGEGGESRQISNTVRAARFASAGPHGPPLRAPEQGEPIGIGEMLRASGWAPPDAAPIEPGPIPGAPA